MPPNQPKPALLGEGSYGCVFEPPIPCTSPVVPLEPARPRRAKAPRMVGKLFTDPISFREELKLTRVAMDAVKGEKEKHLLLPTGYCRTSMAQVAKHPSHQDCENLYDVPANKRGRHPFYQLLMPYGGTRFDRYIRKQAKKALFPSDRLLRMLVPLVEGLVHISQRGYCHQDIKTGNMLVMPNGKLILIDYGLMVAKRDMYKPMNASRLRYTYFPYPPEYKIASYIVKDRCCNPVVEVYKNIEHLGLERRNTYLSMHPAKQTDADIASLYHDLSKAGKEGIQGVLGPYADRVDVYSLGMAIVDLWRYLEVNEGLVMVVSGMTEPDPRKRWGPEELLVVLRRYFGAKG